MSQNSIDIPDNVHPKFRIGKRAIGTGNPTYIIAELSANHGQNLQRAKQLIQAAADAGADAVKLQTYTADTLTLDCDAECFQIKQGTVWDGQRMYDLYNQAYTPWEWHAELKQEANQLGLQLFSSPFDHSAVDFLESLDVPAYKVASFEIVDIPLIERIARTGKPVIVSTGMATFDEIQLAVSTLRSNGITDIALLKCTSAYPALPESMNLRTLPDLADEFDVVAGLSDHTLGIETAIASVCLGGSIIEKHMTLCRADGGPDSGFSLEPDEFQQLVDSVRHAERALGKVHYGPTEFDKGNLDFRRSLFVVQDIPDGGRFTTENVRSIRPGHGLPPKHFKEVMGKQATADLPRGTPLNWSHVA